MKAGARSGVSCSKMSAPQLSQMSAPTKFTKPHTDKASHRRRPPGLRRSRPRRRSLHGPRLAAVENFLEITSPERATAAASWPSMSSSCRSPDASNTPTGTGKSGQNIRDSTSAVGVRVLDGSVVDEEVGLGHAVLADGHDLGMEPAQADALVAILAEDHRLAILEDDIRPRGTSVTGGEVAPRPVVEDVAVLEDLDEGAALFLWRPACSSVACMCRWYGCRPSAPRMTPRPPGRPSAAGWECRSSLLGVDLVRLPNSEVGDAWPLVSPVYPVVEHDQ